MRRLRGSLLRERDSATVGKKGCFFVLKNMVLKSYEMDLSCRSAMVKKFSGPNIIKNCQRSMFLSKLFFTFSIFLKIISFNNFSLKKVYFEQFFFYLFVKRPETRARFSRLQGASSRCERPLWKPRFQASGCGSIDFLAALL